MPRPLDPSTDSTLQAVDIPWTLPQVAEPVESGRVMTADDLVIVDLAEENADLREVQRQLVDLLANLAVENATLRLLYHDERRSRVYGDAQITRLQRRLREPRRDGR